MARFDRGDGGVNLGLLRLNGRGQQESLLFFTMDEKNLTWAWPDCPHVGQEVLAIRMGREPVELDDLGPARSGHAENLDNTPPFGKFAPKGMLGLKAHKDYHVRFVLNCVLEMMHDAAAFSHAAAGDNDAA